MQQKFMGLISMKLHILPYKVLLYFTSLLFGLSHKNIL